MSGQKTNELTVRVPKPNELKTFSVLKFNASLKIDPTRWAGEGGVTMEREEGKAAIVGLPAVQEYGEGSEYGKAAREEARRKKLGRQLKSYSIDRQPWNMKAKDVDGRERKMHSIREGTKNADYWLFLKSGEDFLAYKVDDWHNLMPTISHRTLDIDEAEEQFQMRNQVMNQFALKANIQQKLKAKEDEEEQISRSKSSLKIKDEASSDSEEKDEDEEEKESERPKKKKKKPTTQNKDKKQRVDNADEVAKYESSDGEDEGREYDYMSDSGSDTDREEVPMEDKVEKALVGVDDEDGLKKMMDSDSDSEDDDPTKKVLGKKDEKAIIDVEERDSSGSDSDDSDKEKVDSVVLRPMKGADQEGPSKRPNTDQPKAPTEAKKPRVEESPSKEGLTEAVVRRLLSRKPHTTKELLTKIKPRCTDLSKPEMVTRLATILKQIEPHQFKQKQGKKEVLFFSLSNVVS